INSDIDSVIINEQQAVWILKKIILSNQKNQRTSGTNNSSHNNKLTLLYRHSRDGSALENFRQMCAEKGTTVVVGKVLNTEEILGGYNPITWSTYSSLPDSFADSAKWVSASESFIFSLDKDRKSTRLNSSHDQI